MTMLQTAISPAATGSTHSISQSKNRVLPASIQFKGEDDSPPSSNRDNTSPAPPAEKKPNLWQTLAIAGLSALHSFSDEATKSILESNVIFMPQAAVDLGDWEKFSVQFKSASGNTVNALHVPAQKGKPTLIFSNGNASKMSELLVVAQQADWQKQGIGFLFYEYPGYGKSEGATNENNIYEAIDAAMNYLKENNVPAKEQVLVGWSLGSAVTAEAASKNDVKGVVLTSPFKNITGMIHAIRKNSGVPDWWFPPQEKENEPFNNVEKAKQIKSPLLVLHGENDELIPVEHGKAVFEAAGSSDKEFKSYPDVTHNDIVIRPEFIKDINAFLAKISAS